MWLAILAALALLGAGCGGINGSQSVSPGELLPAGNHEGRSAGGDQRPGGGFPECPINSLKPDNLCDSHLR
jgi:hypothetical protein